MFNKFYLFIFLLIAITCVIVNKKYTANENFSIINRIINPIKKRFRLNKKKFLDYTRHELRKMEY